MDIQAGVTTYLNLYFYRGLYILLPTMVLGVGSSWDKGGKENIMYVGETLNLRKVGGGGG